MQCKSKTICIYSVVLIDHKHICLFIVDINTNVNFGWFFCLQGCGLYHSLQKRKQGMHTYCQITVFLYIL